MITKNNKQGERAETKKGLESGTPQNHGLNQENKAREAQVNFKDDNEKSTGQEVRETITYDPQLEAQWLAVRDEYLSHYPDLEGMDTGYEKGDFYSLIERLSKKTQRTPEQVQDEIMTWSSPK